MFSHRYFLMYLAVACVIVAGALLAVAMYLRNRHAMRDMRPDRVTWLNAPDTLELDSPQPGRNRHFPGNRTLR